MATINDRRNNVETTTDRHGNCLPIYGYVVFTDSCLIGWGLAEGGRSIYAVAVANGDEEITVLNNVKDRTDMKRGRFVTDLKGIRLGKNDHLRITDRAGAPRWFVCGAFRE